MYSAQEKNVWDEFVSSAKNATFLHKRDFIEYHKDRFEDFSLMIFEEEKLLALLPANRKEDKVFSHQGLTYGGLLFSARLKFQKVMECYVALLKYLKDNEISELIIKPIPRIYEEQPNDEFALFCHKLNAKIDRLDGLSVIDLTNSYTISRNRLEGVKRGELNNLAIEEVVDLEEFWTKILIPNLTKKHNVLPVHSLEDITCLKRKFPKNIRQFNVYHRDGIVAGAVVFETEYVVHLQYISGNSMKNELGSIDYLHHYLITEVFKNKRYFDFGHSSINSGEAINKSLLYWKEGFGARMVQHPTFRIDTANYKNLDNYLR